MGGGVEMQHVRHIAESQRIARSFVHILRPSLRAADDEAVGIVRADDGDDGFVVGLDDPAPVMLVERLIPGLVDAKLAVFSDDAPFRRARFVQGSRTCAPRESQKRKGSLLRWAVAS